LNLFLPLSCRARPEAEAEAVVVAAELGTCPLPASPSRSDKSALPVAAEEAAAAEELARLPARLAAVPIPPAV
jgi:hypothetical protein